jgi:hypothetical protein
MKIFASNLKWTVDKRHLKKANLKFDIINAKNQVPHEKSNLSFL